MTDVPQTIRSQRSQPARSRHQRRRATTLLFVWAAAALVPVTLALRDIFEPQTALLVLAAFALILLGIGVSATDKWHPLPIHRRYVPLLARIGISVLMLAQAFFRGVVPTNSLIGTAVILVAVVLVGLLLVASRTPRERIVEMAADAIALLIIASTVAYMLGMQPYRIWVTPGSMGEAKILTTFGIYLPRTVMPLTLGSTSHAALSGLAAVSASLFLFSKSASTPRRIFSAAALLCGLFGLAVSDGRTATAAFLLVLALLRWAPNSAIRLAPWLLVVSAPLFLLIVAMLPESLLALLARSGSAAEIMSGNNRLFIWSEAWDHFIAHPAGLLFGYGVYGQASSGLSAAYSYLFRNFDTDVLMMSMHNAGLQMLVDGGLVGLAVAVWFYKTVLNRFIGHSGSGTVTDRVAIAIILYTLLVGVMDAFGTLVWRESYYVMILIGIASMEPVRRYGRRMDRLPHPSPKPAGA